MEGGLGGSEGEGGRRVCTLVALGVEVVHSPAVQMNKAGAVQAGEVLLWERLGGGLGLQHHKGVFSSWPGGQDGMGAGTRGRGAGQSPSPPTQLAPGEKQQSPLQPEAAAAHLGKGAGVPTPPATPHKVSVSLPPRLGVPFAVWLGLQEGKSAGPDETSLARSAG